MQNHKTNNPSSMLTEANIERHNRLIGLLRPAVNRPRTCGQGVTTVTEMLRRFGIVLSERQREDLRYDYSGLTPMERFKLENSAVLGNKAAVKQNGNEERKEDDASMQLCLPDLHNIA
ncbi:hypothetical protein AJ80_00264 [Polytolypa hystricis UAMH7299]|uniref:Uncharacterized protein n=1 Tax=Polytolypa hystricis (strain UAMH7299) TaxID=1447883 RepID=A0A2B7Z440_POLH7|nr:hypothetical protein AJ80_00264 [Polytolypa hystricis UAMH7299]